MNTDASLGIAKNVDVISKNVETAMTKNIETAMTKNIETASEIVEKVVEQAVAKAPKKETWISTLFRWFSQIFVFWIGVLIVQVLFSLYATYMFNSKKKSEHDSFEVNDLKRAHGEITFSESESADVQKPQPNAITDLKSDKTVFDILSGAQGPTVVLLQAEWCVHCNNMMPAYEEAAKLSSVPFVRIQGDIAQKTMLHFRINGQPTIQGVDSNKKVFPFATFRTKDEFVSFAKKMTPEGSLAAQAQIFKEPLKEQEQPLKEQPSKDNLPKDTPAVEKVESIEVLDEEADAVAEDAEVAQTEESE